jgi:uncharacterized protein YeaO (DUF488 family)
MFEMSLKSRPVNIMASASMTICRQSLPSQYGRYVVYDHRLWGADPVPIKLKRWNDPADRDDGFRLLICRYRPRGVRKADETWDAWCKDLGPSRELHAAFWGKHGPPIGWQEYRRRYLEEMRGQTERIQELADRVAAEETITLLCSSACLDESHCHRSLLRQLIEKRM